MSVRCIEVSLTIPDNEARTALATLQRLGIGIAGLERADVYLCDVEEAQAEGFVATLRGLETVFNPNKHALRVREDDRLLPGEVWIDEIGSDRSSRDGAIRIAGRALAGVRRLERFTAWRVSAHDRTAALGELVAAATETLLCNPAFQKARL